jgi:hypothetical protein
MLREVLAVLSLVVLKTHSIRPTTSILASCTYKCQYNMSDAI